MTITTVYTENLTDPVKKVKCVVSYVLLLPPTAGGALIEVGATIGSGGVAAITYSGSMGLATSAAAVGVGVGAIVLGVGLIGYGTYKTYQQCRSA